LAGEFKAQSSVCATWGMHALVLGMKGMTLAVQRNPFWGGGYSDRGNLPYTHPRCVWSSHYPLGAAVFCGFGITKPQTALGSSTKAALRCCTDSPRHKLRQVACSTTTPPPHNVERKGVAARPLMFACHWNLVDRSGDGRPHRAQRNRPCQMKGVTGGTGASLTFGQMWDGLH
jgi:hypothetical protein